jgi:Fe-S-cluster containining protein
LAKHHGLSYDEAVAQFTRYEPDYGHHILLHKKDKIYKSSCRFLDTKLRRCTIYEARPALCRQHPEESHCGYYDFLMWERKHQDDDEFIPLSRA